MPDETDTGGSAESASAAPSLVAAAPRRSALRSIPWPRYRSAFNRFPVATTVAVSAFLFSLGNAFFAYCEAQERRDFETRLELRNGIEALAVAEARFQDAVTRCQQQNQCSAQDFEQQNYDAKVQRAVELVDEARANSAEVRAVARSVAGTQRYELALALYSRAVAISPDEYERTQSVIGMATVLYEEDPADARKLLSDQLTRLGKADFESGVERLNLLWRIHSFWVGQEAFSRECRRLEERITAASAVLDQVPPQYYGGFFPTLQQWDAIVKVDRQIAGCT